MWNHLDSDKSIQWPLKRYRNPVHLLQHPEANIFSSSPNSISMYDTDKEIPRMSCSPLSLQNESTCYLMADADCFDEMDLKPDLESSMADPENYLEQFQNLTHSSIEICDDNLAMDDVFSFEQNDSCSGPTLAELNGDSILNDLESILNQDLENDNQSTVFKATSTIISLNTEISAKFMRHPTVSIPVDVHQSKALDPLVSPTAYTGIGRLTLASPEKFNNPSLALKSNSLPVHSQLYEQLQQTDKQTTLQNLLKKCTTNSNINLIAASCPTALWSFNSNPDLKPFTIKSPSVVTPSGIQHVSSKDIGSPPSNITHISGAIKRSISNQVPIVKKEPTWEAQQFLNNETLLKIDIGSPPKMAKILEEGCFDVKPTSISHPHFEIKSETKKDDNTNEEEADKNTEEVENDYDANFWSDVESQDEDDESRSPKKEKRFFWQYNTQSKGPKGKRLCKTMKTEDPHILDDFEDPVFDPDLNQMQYKHNGKARKGDGNDITPDSFKLYRIGIELKRLNKTIRELTPVNELPLNNRSKSRKEKNKLASRACRLKKKAQHEANKLKLFGLNTEHKNLMAVIDGIRDAVFEHISKDAPPDSEMLLAKYDKLISEHLTIMIAGHTTEYVNSVLMKVQSGDKTGGL